MTTGAPGSFDRWLKGPRAETWTVCLGTRSRLRTALSYFKAVNWFIYMNESNICTLRRAGGDVLAPLGCEHCSCARKTGVNRLVPRRSSSFMNHDTSTTRLLITTTSFLPPGVGRAGEIRVGFMISTTFSGRCDANGRIRSCALQRQLF